MFPDRVMKNKDEIIIGSVMVVDESNKMRSVIICQDNVTHYKGENSHSKNMYLDNKGGIKVFKTDDPDIFMLMDGTILRKKRFR